MTPVEHLYAIIRELRDVGDVPLVLLTDDGVGPAPISLADELWLIARRLEREGYPVAGTA